MGYTLELWALPVNRLARELREPTLRSQDVKHAEGMEDIVERWAALAAEVASLTGRGAELSGDRARYVALVIRTLGSFYGALNHTSSGGMEFREQLRTVGAQQVGAEVVDHLLERPLEGLEWFDYPLVGWVSARELENVPRTPTFEVEEDENLHTLHQAAARAADLGTDVVSIYL
jgi:hypothetical protein